jgi:UDP-galactopyranose mutase
MNAETDLICFSHLRWNFVFQRPNHLMSLCSAGRRVFFLEEPAPGDSNAGRLSVSRVAPNLHVVVPRLLPGQDHTESSRLALVELCERYAIERPISWFYTPMALEFTREMPSSLVIYDCMDELSAFRGAPPQLVSLEREMFERADLVFTGGASLFQAKRNMHPNIHCFPSSVDVAHFAAARGQTLAPLDQASIPRPRLGFFGVIDERLDLALLQDVAASRPDWHVVVIGPVVKIDPATLPRLPNIRYLGPKPYAELPNYLAGWDVALMPFALNESTRFISPTKTLEYLAGGRRVVSTPIADVISPYAERGFVRVAAGADPFIDAIQAALNDDTTAEKQEEVDAFIAGTSWAGTWARMSALMDDALRSSERRKDNVA